MCNALGSLGSGDASLFPPPSEGGMLKRHRARCWTVTHSRNAPKSERRKRRAAGRMLITILLPASAGRDFRFSSLIPGVALGASRMRNVPGARYFGRIIQSWRVRLSLSLWPLFVSCLKTRYSAASCIHLLILVRIRRPSPSRSDAGNLISCNPVI